MDHRTMKSKQSHTFTDMYKTMPIDVDYGVYKRVLECMRSTILEHLLMRSEGFKMPYGLGFIQVCKYLPKTYAKDSLSVDYATSKQYDKRILVRDNKRKLAQLIFNKQDYIDIHDIQLYKV